MINNNISFRFQSNNWREESEEKNEKNNWICNIFANCRKFCIHDVN
mgnify:CR=1 FL=1